MEGNNGPVAVEHNLAEPPRKKPKLEADIPLKAIGNTAHSKDATTTNLKDLSSSLARSIAQSIHPNTKAMAVPPAQDETLLEQGSKEAACGITEFVCPETLGFSGIFKKRYTDFLVNEILPSGIVVHLDNTQVPKRQKKHRDAEGYTEITSHASNTDQNTPAANATEVWHSTAEGHKASGSSEDTRKKEVTEPAITKPALSSAYTSGPNHAPESTSYPPQTQRQIASPENSDSYAPHPANPQSTHPIPQSMQDLDLPEAKPKTVAPHMRAPAPSQSIPQSMQDPDDRSKITKPSPRKKETVRIRQTSDGWVEVNEQDQMEPKSSEDAAVNERMEDAANQKEENIPLLGNETAKSPHLLGDQASWQAFANETAADADITNGFQLRSEDLTSLLTYLGSETTNAILALHDRILNSPHRKARDYGKVTSASIDRHTRSKIHGDLRRIFDSRLESSTDATGCLIISAAPVNPSFHAKTPMSNDRSNYDRSTRGRNRNSRGRGRQDEPYVSKRDQWAELGGEHLHFSLCKENKDTMECVSYLSRLLNMRPSAFQFAGTKDRRGVTVQRISTYRVLADRLLHVGHTLKRAKIGNFEYHSQPLQLGELTGNEFAITLRDCNFHYPIPVESNVLVEAAQAVVGDAIRNLAANGFINYYGLQRFGTFSMSTDEVGVKMLQGDFKAAVDGILNVNHTLLEAAKSPVSAAGDKQSSDDLARALAIDSFRATGDGQRALESMPKKFTAERSILLHLSKSNTRNDFLGAMQSISRNLRLMYVHAYQSLVWNMAASERWKRFGATVVEGDLVLIDEHKNKTETNNKPADVDMDGEAIIRPSEDDRAVDPEDMFIRARALSKEEADGGMYTIFDVVLPTPGFDIIYPANEMVKFYESFMASERGGGLDPHNMRRKWKDVSLSGSYRKLIARPSKDISFDVKVYKNEDEQFVKTDLDRLEKAKQERNNAQHSRSAPLRDDPAKAEHHRQDSSVNFDDKKMKQETFSSTDSEPGGVSLSGGPYRDYKIAVILKLQLGSSQYATIALRELMKHGGARMYKPDFASDR